MRTAANPSSAVAYGLCNPASSRREQIAKTCKYLTGLIMSDLPKPGLDTIGAMYDYLSDFSELASTLRLIERHLLLHVFTQHSNPDRPLDVKAADAESLILSRLARIHGELLDRLEDKWDFEENPEPGPGSPSGPAPSSPAPPSPAAPSPRSGDPQATTTKPQPANNDPQTNTGLPQASNTNDDVQPETKSPQPAPSNSISNFKSQTSNSPFPQISLQNAQLKTHNGEPALEIHPP